MSLSPKRESAKIGSLRKPTPFSNSCSLDLLSTTSSTSRQPFFHQRLQLVITELIRYVQDDKRYRQLEFLPRIPTPSPRFSRGTCKKFSPLFDHSWPPLHPFFHQHHHQANHPLTRRLPEPRNRNHGYLSRFSSQALRFRCQACLLPYVEPILYMKNRKSVSLLELCLASWWGFCVFHTSW